MAARAAQRQHSMVWLQGLVCGALVTLAPGTALLFAVLLGPGFVALVADRIPGRPVGRAVLLFGLAASVQPLYALWSSGRGIDAALALVSDIRVLGSAWSASAGGWLLAEVAPLGARLVLEMLARTRAAQLRAERERLKEQWGLGDGSGN